jgi:hypothetical protein
MNRDPNADKMPRLFKGMAGFFLVLFSTPCVVAMLHDLIVGGDHLVGAIAAGSFFSILLLAGLFLLYRAFRKPAERPLYIEEHIERLVLHVARVHGGSLTQAQLAMSSSLTLEQARVILTEFERRGVVYSVITESGGMSYMFPDLLTSADPSEERVFLDLKGSASEDPAAVEAPAAQTVDGR